MSLHIIIIIDHNTWSFYVIRINTCFVGTHQRAKLVYQISSMTYEQVMTCLLKFFIGKVYYSCECITTKVPTTTIKGKYCEYYEFLFLKKLYRKQIVISRLMEIMMHLRSSLILIILCIKSFHHYRNQAM